MQCSLAMEEVFYCTQGGIYIKTSLTATQIVSGGRGSSETVDWSDECLSGEIKTSAIKGKERWLQNVTDRSSLRQCGVYQSGQGSRWTNWYKGGHVRTSHGDASAIVINSLGLSFTWLSSCRSGFNKCCCIMLPCAWLLWSPQLHIEHLRTTYISGNNVRLFFLKKIIISYYQKVLYDISI